MAAAGGAGVGWFYAVVINSCGGTCLVGAQPWIVIVGLALVGGYAAMVATRPQAQ
ncbi:MAG: hypothetical protein BWY17_03633 [Deltaproteobacteria bacterium ADurb.Bin207]|nr:MAG: hypothetical protein BWY17_03633 [Deltaproteobacteria bacterium ADurb.Bin207]